MKFLLKLIIFPFKFIFWIVPKFIFKSVLRMLISILIVVGIIAFIVTAFAIPGWWPS